jgi:hypothetical protein
MGDPDLKLGGLSVWVRERANPEVSDYWDGNWLIVQANMQVGQSSVTTGGAILMTTDVEQFRNQLAVMHEALTGEASLSGSEPNLEVTVRMNRLGQIVGQVIITPDHLTEHHRFDIELDQSYLPALITSCDSIIQRFPTVGWLGG